MVENSVYKPLGLIVHWKDYIAKRSLLLLRRLERFTSENAPIQSLLSAAVFQIDTKGIELLSQLMSITHICFYCSNEAFSIFIYKGNFFTQKYTNVDNYILTDKKNNRSKSYWKCVCIVFKLNLQDFKYHTHVVWCWIHVFMNVCFCFFLLAL